MMGQLFAFYYVATVYLTTFLMFFGICVYLVALFVDYEANLNDLGKTIANFTQNGGKWTSEGRCRLRLTIYEFIRFHGDIYMLVKECSTTYRTTTSAFFLNGALLCCTLLLQFHLVRSFVGCQHNFHEFHFLRRLLLFYNNHTTISLTGSTNLRLSAYSERTINFVHLVALVLSAL